MKLSPDLHDDDLDGPEVPEYDAPDGFAEAETFALGAEAFPLEPANETDGAGAFELVNDAHEQIGRPEPHSMAERLNDAFAGDDGAGEASVPRIVIHGFYERQDTADTLALAAADRRMARATTDVRPGGLTAAVEHYQTHPTPSLVIVESAAPAAQLLSELEALADVCDPGTKVMVVGAANDIALYRELMRKGVSEYLVPPLKALGVIRSITDLYADPSAPFVGARSPSWAPRAAWAPPRSRTTWRTR
jgi:pilus assembly protein CpaE